MKHLVFELVTLAGGLVLQSQVVVANYVLQEAQARLRKSTSAKTLHFWRLKLAFPHHSPHPNRRMVTFQY
jgi:hypothetical protein